MIEPIYFLIPLMAIALIFAGSLYCHKRIERMRISGDTSYKNFKCYKYFLRHISTSIPD